MTTYQQAQLQVVGYRKIQTNINEVLGLYGINTSQWIIMGWLSDNPEGLRVSALAEVLQVEVPLVTNLLQQLEDLSYISLTPDENDRRAKVVQLAPTGDKKLPVIESELRSHLRTLTSQVPTDTMERYFEVLQSIGEKAKL